MVVMVMDMVVMGMVVVDMVVIADMVVVQIGAMVDTHTLMVVVSPMVAMDNVTLHPFLISVDFLIILFNYFYIITLGFWGF